MKKFIFLLLIIHQVIASQYIVKEIETIDVKKIFTNFYELKDEIPKKDQWEKDSEYKQRLQDYYELYAVGEYKTYKFEVEIAVSSTTYSRGGYNIETDELIFNPSSREFTSRISGNRHTLSFENLPKFKVNIPRDFMRDNIEDFKLYGLVRIFSNPWLEKYIKENEILGPDDRLFGSSYYDKTYVGDFIGWELLLDGRRYENLISESNKSDNEYIPLFKVQPVYPRRAAERGTEGYAIVSFKLTELGTVENIRIIEGKCRSVVNRDGEFTTCSMFNSASIRAASKLKYKPIVRDGRAIAVDDVLHKFTFELE